MIKSVNLLKKNVTRIHQTEMKAKLTAVWSTDPRRSQHHFHS